MAILASPVEHVATAPRAPLLMHLWRHGEAVSFWALVILYLAPVWAFPYLPTQDGPSHLTNAQILKDLGRSPVGYEALFEVRAEPVPNWTSHLLLAGLMYLVPPLIAEKLLVSLYVLGFAGALRYFLGAFGERCRPLSWVGLLFVYNRCFWMGFYNYCLSLALIWLIMGYCLRRQRAPTWTTLPVLMLLFATAYLTHLAGWLLALGGSLLAALLARPRSLTAAGLILLAALPSALLTLDYFEATSFFRAGPVQRVTRQPLAWLRGAQREQPVGKELANLEQELFTHHAENTPLGLLLLSYALMVAGFGVTEFFLLGRPAGGGAGLLSPAVLGLLLLGLYLIVPNDLGAADGVLPNGGFLKCRLALLPPLVFLACLREPVHASARLLQRGLMLGLLAVNLVLVTQKMQEGNQLLEQYTAGIEAVGREHWIDVTNPGREGKLANPLSSAANYYCLGKDNLYLENYEASTPHFPIRFRKGITRQAARTKADILICWRSLPGPSPQQWQEIFSRGTLRIFRASKPPDRGIQ